MLGLSSSHSLRAEKLTDFINISSGRSTAEVALRFSDGTKIRRRIKRTENGYYSYFYMNDRLSKQSEVADFLGGKARCPAARIQRRDAGRYHPDHRDEATWSVGAVIDGSPVWPSSTSGTQALTGSEVVRDRVEREEASAQGGVAPARGGWPSNGSRRWFTSS